MNLSQLCCFRKRFSFLRVCMKHYRNYQKKILIEIIIFYDNVQSNGTPEINFCTYSEKKIGLLILCILYKICFIYSSFSLSIAIHSSPNNILTYLFFLTWRLSLIQINVNFIEVLVKYNDNQILPKGHDIYPYYESNLNLMSN